MKVKYLLTIAGVAALAANAQNFERRADITGGGDRWTGQCTIEVWVDGTAEVEIRGDRAVIHNLAGQPPQWRRFVCNMPMPMNPQAFRFEGVDGRGRQTLTRLPERGPAVVRIEDPQGGAEGYTFRFYWRVEGAPPPVQVAPPPPDRGGDRGY